jgi:coenzyme F420-reducing hydrogenase alpha subunit
MNTVDDLVFKVKGNRVGASAPELKALPEAERQKAYMRLRALGSTVAGFTGMAAKMPPTMAMGGAGAAPRSRSPSPKPKRSDMRSSIPIYGERKGAILDKVRDISDKILAERAALGKVKSGDYKQLPAARKKMYGKELRKLYEEYMAAGFKTSDDRYHFAENVWPATGYEKEHTLVSLAH